MYLLFCCPGVRGDGRRQQPGGGLVLRGRGGAGRGGAPLGADGAGDAQGRRHVAHPQIDALALTDLLSTSCYCD